jgi:hypothetical protein
MPKNLIFSNNSVGGAPPPGSAPAWYLLILNKKELPVNSKVLVQLKNTESTKDSS